MKVAITSTFHHPHILKVITPKHPLQKRRITGKTLRFFLLLLLWRLSITFARPPPLFPHLPSAYFAIPSGDTFLNFHSLMVEHFFSPFGTHPEQGVLFIIALRVPCGTVRWRSSINWRTAIASSSTFSEADCASFACGASHLDGSWQHPVSSPPSMRRNSGILEVEESHRAVIQHLH